MRNYVSPVIFDKYSDIWLNLIKMFKTLSSFSFLRVRVYVCPFLLISNEMKSVSRNAAGSRKKRRWKKGQYRQNKDTTKQSKCARCCCQIFDVISSPLSSSFQTQQYQCQFDEMKVSLMLHFTGR